MNFYGWDICYVLPIHFVEMYLANGCLFENETQIEMKSRETAQMISDKCYVYLNEMLKQSPCFKN